jgi:SAM-dependent methyltransferase
MDLRPAYARSAALCADRVRDLDGVPVFYELWSGVDGASSFDYELDAAAKARYGAGGVVRGICNVSGRPDQFRLTGESYRESVTAQESGTNGRVRAIAASLSWALFGDPFSSLPATCDALVRADARVFIAEAGGALPRALSRHLGPRLASSEYFGPEHRSGTIVNGIRHEDLQQLSFPDESFDVVITTDVMEHVPDAPAAEREIVRVLRPHGWLLFTIPFYFNLVQDRVRAAVAADGTIVHYEEPQYHGDPVRPETGALVFRDFAESELRERFAALRCSFDIVRFWSSAMGIVGADMIVMAVQRQT